MIRINKLRIAIACAMLVTVIGVPAEATTPALATRTKPVARIVGSSTHSAIQIGKTFVLSGKVTPIRAGVVLKRQRYSGGKWIFFGALTRTDAQGKWSMRVKAPLKPSIFRVRVVAPKFPGSAPFKKVVNVTAPLPNPSATINAIAGDQVPGTFIMLAGTHQYPGTNMLLVIQREVDGTGASG